MLVNYYDLLEITRTATAEDIRAAITKQRRIWVRRQSSPDPDRRAEAEQRVRQIDQAEKTLLNSAERSAFDARLAGERSPLPPPRADRRTGTEQPPPSGQRTAHDWLERARTFLAQGNLGAATRAAREATSLAPGLAEAWHLYAQASAEDDRPADAEWGYAEAIDLEPGNLDFRRGLGEAYLKQRKWRQAVTEFERVLQQSPDDARARAGLGEAYVNNGNAKQGLVLLEKAVEASPDDVDVKTSYAYALHDSAVDNLSELDTGARLVLSRRQLALVRRNARKIRALRLGDPKVRELSDELRSLAKDAAKPIWMPSFHKRYYAIALGLAILLMALAPRGIEGGSLYQGVGVVMALIVVGWYVWRHRIPAWKIRRKDLGQKIVRRGL
jgi:Tfp pilus assembly protein PilF